MKQLTVFFPLFIARHGWRCINALTGVFAKQKLQLMLLASMLIALSACPTGTNTPGNNTSDNGTLTETVATPTASPGGGTYPAVQTVTLHCETTGAVIHYTLDGTTPTASSPIYHSPLTIDHSLTLKVIAVKTGMNNSNILTAAYTITAPALETVATPTASPPGGAYSTAQTVTLATATEGAAIHYTLDGSEPDTTSPIYHSSLLIPNSSLLKAVAVKSGMNNSGILTAAYTIQSVPETPINLSLGGVNAQLTASTGVISIANYADPATITAFTITNTAAQSAINGKAITVQIDASGARDISLAYVHYLRQALLTGANAASSVSVTADPDKFTPVFDGRDWWTHYWEEKDLYSYYPKGADAILMNGITISTNSTDNKYIIVYDRPIKVSRPVWQNNNMNEEVSFHGFGLKKGTSESGSILLDSGKKVVFGGVWREESNDLCEPVVADFAAYESALIDAGLHPSQNDSLGAPVRLDHSRVRVSGITGSTNVMANGLYDFVLGYYNPAPTGATPNDDALKALLPNWRLSDLAFDGYAKDAGGNYGPNYTPAVPDGFDIAVGRDIGGITCSASERKATADGTYGSIGGGYNGQAYQKDEPRVDFLGSITYAMAQYMSDKFSIQQFQNTNIIGDWSIWNVVKKYNNVALIGDYSSQASIGVEAQGVIDIKGRLPEQIKNTLTGLKYLNIWSDVSRESNIYGFPVIVIRGTGGEYVTTGRATAPGTEAKVIIYHKKYGAAPLSNNNTQPDHRAFVVNAGGTPTPKITGGSIPGANTAWYQGTKPTNPIPCLDESAWIEYANGRAALPSNLAANYAGLPADRKITDPEFLAVPVE